jgi:hypothetical protein
MKLIFTFKQITYKKLRSATGFPWGIQQFHRKVP